MRADLQPEGDIFIAGELWKAMAVDDTIKAGERVIVTGIDGLKLKVKRIDHTDQTAMNGRHQSIKIII